MEIALSILISGIYINYSLDSFIIGNKLSSSDEMEQLIVKIALLMMVPITIPFVLEGYLISNHIIVTILLLIAAEDCISKLISNRNVTFILVVNLLVVISSGRVSVSILGGLIMPSSIILLISIASGHNIGMGDIKLIAALGLGCGMVNGFMMMVYASLLAGIFAGILVARRLITLKDSIPFAPFIIAGYFLTCL